MNLSEKKRNSVIYRKKIKFDFNNYINLSDSKEKNTSRKISDYSYKMPEEKNISNGIQNYNSKNEKIINTKKIKLNKNNNSNSLTSKNTISFYNRENTKKINLPTENIRKNLRQKLILNFFTSNNLNNHLLKYNNTTNRNIDKPDINYHLKYYSNLTNKNNEEKKRNSYNIYKTIKDENDDEIMDSKSLFVDKNKANKLRKISYESYINDSIFIKKKARDNYIRNRSTIDNERDILEETYNSEIFNQNGNRYINKSLDFRKPNNKTKSINNNNININISINNNYLTEENDNVNPEREEYKYKINKTKTNYNYIIKTIEKKKTNKKLIKETTDFTKKGKLLESIINNNLKKQNNLNNSNSDLINKKLYNLEDFLLIIQKFESIKEKFISFSDNINKYNSKQLLEYINLIRIKLYDLYEFYMSCSIEGKPQNLFISKISKNCLHYYSVVLLLSIGLSYVISQKIKTTIDYNGKLLILLNLQEKAFMTFCDSIIKKLNDNYQTNIWVIEIIKKLNNQLISNADTVNHILQIKMLSTDSYKIINDILINMYILYNKNEANKQEIFLYNYFHNKDFNYLTQFNINEIEELFDKNIFKAINLRSNYANIASLKSRNKAPFKEDNKNTRIFISRNEKKDIKNLYDAYNTYQNFPNKIKVPYLNFPSKKKYTLVLDLDETMVSFKFTEISLGIGKLHLRPGLEEFLEELKNYFEIIVFTSGTKDYADTILNIIEQKSNSKFFDGLLYREHTTLIGKKYIKDLSKLGRDLSKTIIVDNLPQSFKLQRENGILINSFYGDNMNDKALYELKRILINIYNDKSDVRDSIIKYKEDIIKNVTCIDGDGGKN